MTRVLVAWCPDWPVTAVFRDPAEAASPAAVAEQGRVAACCGRARDQGVRRGQRVRDAQRHCTGLLVRDRDRDAEGRLFEAMAVAMERVTPRLEVLRPGVCACPAGGAARYFGGEPALRDRVAGVAADAGLRCGIGIADGMFAAGLAARTGEGIIVPPEGSTAFLASQSVGVLDRADLTDLLDRLGIRTLGAFAALSQARVEERFGPPGVLAHRLARGLDPRPLSVRGPRKDLSVRTVFDPPARAAEQVVFAAIPLAEELHAGLAGAGHACVRLSIEVGFTAGTPCTRLWRHDGSLVATAVAERVRWQLAGRGAHPGSTVDGVSWLRLVPDQLVVDGGDQWALWGRPFDAERARRAAARVQAMLGHRSVLRPVATGGRGPADRVIKVPFGDIVPPREADGPWPGRVPTPAPTVVHPEPLAALLTDAEGRPVTVSGRCMISAPPARLSVAGRRAVPVTAWTGPWPADEFWWDERRAIRRARFQLVTGDGCGYLLTRQNEEWQVEACYE